MYNVVSTTEPHLGLRFLTKHAERKPSEPFPRKSQGTISSEKAS